MSWFDLALLSILCISFVLGLSQGFIKRAFGILAFFTSIISACMFYDVAASLFLAKKIVAYDSVALVGGFIVVFLITYLIFFPLGWVLTSIVGALSLKWLDRVAGGVVGLLAGAVFCLALAWALSLAIPPSKPPFSDSLVLPYVKRGLNFVKDFVPEGYGERIYRARDAIYERGLEIKRGFQGVLSAPDTSSGGGVGSPPPSE
ncbi:MAG: CvpA family protein [Candidatus Methanosuratincola sp.]|jgi:membrane protein required for colicin V production